MANLSLKLNTSYRNILSVIYFTVLLKCTQNDMYNKVQIIHRFMIKKIYYKQSALNLLRITNILHKEKYIKKAQKERQTILFSLSSSFAYVGVHLLFLPCFLVFFVLPMLA